MQEMLHPTAFLKGAGLGAKCALVTDGRFSGGSSGISVGHISPEAAAGGTIGLVENGDRIRLDVRARSLELLVDAETLADRRAKMESSERPWQPVDRQRVVSKALRAYAHMATSADTGAVRRPDPARTTAPVRPPADRGRSRLGWLSWLPEPASEPVDSAISPSPPRAWAAWA